MRFRVIVLLVAAGVVVGVVVGVAPAAAERDVGSGRAPVTTPWTPPLPGPLQVIRPFEAPAHRYAPGHRGVDLAAPAGATVGAAGDGVVFFAGMVAGRPVVGVDHGNGLRTTYEPVDPSVGAGQPVARGSPLGSVLAGHGGCRAAACLHWGLRRGETYLDPMTLLVPPRVRLLPMR